jgi:predicted dienelactone hydrolase
VVMAPNAVRFTDEALARVTVPVLVYAGEKDDLTRLPYHGERLSRVLPRVDCVVVNGADHFSFLASFPAALRLVGIQGTRDPDGFDRDAFHEGLNREIVAFFDRTLGRGGDTLATGAEPRGCRARGV